MVLSPALSPIKKGYFGWNDEAEAVFLALKSVMTTMPTLGMPNFNDSFIIEANTSGDGISAVLAQQGKPIAFMSRALGISKRSWSVYAKEMLAIVEAIRIWRPYLLGRKFIIRTNQKSLKYLLEQQITTSNQQWWMAKLLGYDYEIQYRPDRENTATDSLSRKPATPIINSLFVSQVHIWEEIKEATCGDEYTIQLSRAT